MIATRVVSIAVMIFTRKCECNYHITSFLRLPFLSDPKPLDVCGLTSSLCRPMSFTCNALCPSALPVPEYFSPVGGLHLRCSHLGELLQATDPGSHGPLHLDSTVTSLTLHGQVLLPSPALLHPQDCCFPWPGFIETAIK